MTTLLAPPPMKAIRAVCSFCHGTGKRAAEWELSGAIVSYLVCSSCLGRGEVLIDAPLGEALVEALAD